MAALAWKRRLTSALFTFVVGPEKEEFAIHSGCLTEISPYFETLINGKMAEAKDRRVIWDDIEVNTFLVLSNFAYTGNYASASNCFPATTQKGDKKSQDNAAATPNSQAMAKVRKEFNNKLLRASLNECLLDGGSLLAYPKFDTLKPLEEFATFVKFFESFDAYERTSFRMIKSPIPLSAHIKIYVLADRYCVDALRQQAFRYVCWALATWTVKYDSITVMRPIVRYVFENTQELDDIQKAFIDWGCCLCEAAAGHPDWKQTLLDTPAFAAGILMKIVV